MLIVALHTLTTAGALLGGSTGPGWRFPAGMAAMGAGMAVMGAAMAVAADPDLEATVELPPIGLAFGAVMGSFAAGGSPALATLGRLGRRDGRP